MILATGPIQSTDPATTKLNPAFNPNQAVGPNNLQYLRAQFPGNIIPASRLQGSLAQGWFKFLPNPTSPGSTEQLSCSHARAGYDSCWSATTTWENLTSISVKQTTLQRQSGAKLLPQSSSLLLPIQLADETYSDPAGFLGKPV